MEFTGKQLTAMLKMGLAMVEADGKVTEEEKVALTLDLMKFGVTPEQLGVLLPAANAMSAEESLIIAAGMNAQQKKYVTGYLAMIMASDGVDETEVKLWSVLSHLCGFPIMTIAQALEFWKNN